MCPGLVELTLKPRTLNNQVLFPENSPATKISNKLNVVVNTGKGHQIWNYE